jgi:hypothetical protein
MIVKHDELVIYQGFSHRFDVERCVVAMSSIGGQPTSNIEQHRTKYLDVVVVVVVGDDVVVSSLSINVSFGGGGHTSQPRRDAAKRNEAASASDSCAISSGIGIDGIAATTTKRVRGNSEKQAK